MAKNRINELKQKEFNRRVEELFDNQEKEKQEVEEAHFMEYQEFNNRWDSEMAKTQQDNSEQIRQLEDKHIKELEENRAKMEVSIPTIPKQSSELLNLKKIEEQLGL